MAQQRAQRKRAEDNARQQRNEAVAARKAKERKGNEERRKRMAECIQIGTLNVQTLSDDARLVEMASAMRAHNLGICALQEVRRKTELRGRQLHGISYYTGPCGAFATGGCGFALDDEKMKQQGLQVTEVTHHSERMSEMRLQQGERTVTIISAYAPCSTHTDEEAAEYYEFLTAQIRRIRGLVVVLGDMNGHVPSEVDQCKTNRNGRHLQDMTAELGMVMINMAFRKPVRKMWTWQGDTAVFRGKRINDYVLVKERHRQCFLDCEAVRAEIITDHRLVRATFRTKWKAKQPRQQKPREEERVGEGRQAAVVEPHSVEGLQRELEALAGGEAKKEKKRGGIHLGKEYITAETWAAIAAKKKAYYQSKRTPTTAARQAYERQRIQVKRLVRRDTNERFRRWSEQVEKAFEAGAFEEGFRAVRGVYKQKPRRGGITRDRHARESLTTYTEQLLNTTATPPVPHPAVLQPVVATQRIRDDVPDDEELEEALKRLRDTAPGRDGVRVRWLKKNKRMKGVVFELVKEAWRTGRIPSAWREATMVMIEKVSGAKKWEDHRGITLLSCTGKLAMRVILHRTRGLELMEIQHGFRQARSTIGPVCYLKNLAQQARKRTTEVVMAFVDLTKAYDSIDRQSLWQAMREYGFGQQTLGLVQAMYQDDVLVKLDGVMHDRSFATTRGVRQGCLLSPLAFNIVLDKVFRTALPKLEGVQWRDESSGRQWTSKAIAYADDIVLFAPSMASMQRNLDQLAAHMAAVHLTISVKKTKCMVIGRAKVEAGDCMDSDGGGPSMPEEGAPAPQRAIPELGAQRIFVQWTAGDGYQQCPRCDHLAKTATTLRVHLLNIHKQDATVGAAPLGKKLVVPDEGQGKNTCPRCFKQFSDSSGLRGHYKRKACIPALQQATVGVSTCRYCHGQFSTLQLTGHQRAGECGRLHAAAPRCTAMSKAGKQCIRKAPCDLHPVEESVCEHCGEQIKSKTTHRCRGKAEVEYAEQYAPRVQERVETGETQPDQLVLYGQQLEKVEQFRYLGRIVTQDDDDGPDIAARLQVARATMARLRHNVFGPACVTTKTKVAVFRTVCAAQLKYGSESWRVTRANEARLRTFQQQCLRRVTKMMPVVQYDDEGEKTIRMPRREAVLERAGMNDLVREIEYSQLRWFGHVLRMDSMSEVKRSYSSRLEGKGKPGFVDDALVAVQLERRMAACGLRREDAEDREVWRKGIERARKEDVRAEETPRARAKEKCGAPTKAGRPCQQFVPCRHHPRGTG